MRVSVWLQKRGGALLNATDKSNSLLRITQTCDLEKIHATSHGENEQQGVLDRSSRPMCGLWDGFDGGSAACCLTWWLRRINWSTKEELSSSDGYLDTELSCGYRFELQFCIAREPDTWIVDTHSYMLYTTAYGLSVLFPTCLTQPCALSYQPRFIETCVDRMSICASSNRWTCHEKVVFNELVLLN